jgi:hypothetical protein
MARQIGCPLPRVVKRAVVAILLPLMAALVASSGCGLEEFPHSRPSVEDQASPEVALDLAGVQITRQDAVAFIHFGHSNMAGRATGPAADRPYFFEETDPHAFMYHVGKPMELALEPYTATDRPERMGGGPGTALVKQAAALAPGTYFISLGYGRSAATCAQYLPGSLYYDAAMEAALAIKDRVTFAAIVIMLGIAEVHGTPADISGFSDCIARLVTAIREDVARPDLPVLISDYEQNATGKLAVDTDFARAIMPQIRSVPERVSNSAVVPTDGLGMQDDHHFDLTGHKMWTQRVLQIMQDRGWFPWRP